MGFMADMNRISKRINSDLDQLGRAVKIETFSGVIRDTRVDTGRARGNWQASEERPVTSEIERFDKTENGQPTIDEETSKVNGISLSYLVNNLQYIGFLEEKDAMVATNVQRVRQNIERQAKRVRR